MKNAFFHPKVKSELQDYPKEVRKALGKAVFDLQLGEKLSMPLSKPMASVSAGVEELRIKDKVGVYRFFYMTKIKDKILIFHCFQKKTQKTPIDEILLGKKRLKEMLNEEEN